MDHINRVDHAPCVICLKINSPKEQTYARSKHDHNLQGATSSFVETTKMNRHPNNGVSFVSDVAVFVVKRDVKLQPTNQPMVHAEFHFGGINLTQMIH